MVRLIFEGYAIVNGVISKEYVSKQNECIELCLFSPPSCFFYDTLSIKHDKVIKNPRLKILDWGNTCEIRALPEPPSSPPLAIKQQGHTYRGKEYLLTIYKDNALKVLLENDSEHFPFSPSTPISSPQITTKETTDSLLFTITASCNNGDYILVLKASPDINILLEEYGSSIIIDNNDITITKTIADMRMRTIVTTYTYNTNKFVISSNMFKYSNEHIYTDDLKPYLLLEAIKVGDIGAAKSLLSSDLSERAELLIDYFGSYKDIDYPKYNSFTDNSLAVINEDDTISYYKFEINDGLITNIKEL